MTLRFICPILACLSIYACSIKENREDCPCLLTINLDDAQQEDSVAISLFQKNKMILNKTIKAADYSSEYQEYVKRGNTVVTCLRGLDDNKANDRNVEIERGDDSDPVYASSMSVACNSEFAYTTTEFHKNWAKLEIIVENMIAHDAAVQLTVSGNVKGFDKMNMEPLSGEFSCSRRMSDGQSKNYEVNLPRQKVPSDDLTVALKDSKEDKPIQIIDLKSILEKSNYDWTKKDLDDIRLTIDFAEPSIQINIIDWLTGMETGIVI